MHSLLRENREGDEQDDLAYQGWHVEPVGDFSAAEEPVWVEPLDQWAGEAAGERFGNLTAEAPCCVCRGCVVSWSVCEWM